jgi:hypothetical protein
MDARTRLRPFNEANIPAYEAKCDEYEEIKVLIATWRWSHDAAWARHIARYVTLRTELGRGNELLVFGAMSDDGHILSDLGDRMCFALLSGSKEDICPSPMLH